MARPFNITIRGRYPDGDDAPTVEDLLDQIKDIVTVLRGVEEAISDDGHGELVWRVTDAKKQSPITFEVTPFSKTFGKNIDNRAKQVVSATASGLALISETGERPNYFTDDVMKQAERVNFRVTSGLAKTTLDFRNYGDVPNIELTPESARRTIENIAVIKAPGPIKHRELGSIEGFVARIELDGYGRPIVWIRSRLDRQVFKCISNDHGLDRIGHFEVSEVLKGMRVRVHGLILIRRIATARGESNRQEWAAWYRATFAREPDYAKSVAELGSSPHKRRAILRDYIESSDEDIRAGRKIPTKTHRAVADLAHDGFALISPRRLGHFPC